MVLRGAATTAVVIRAGPKEVTYREAGSRLEHRAPLHMVVPASSVRRHPAWATARALQRRVDRARDEVYRLEAAVDRELERLEAVYDQSPWNFG